MSILPVPLLLAACAWRGPVPTRTVGDLEPSWAIVSATEAAADRVAVQALRQDRTPEGHVVVSLELLNLSGADLSVQVRTAFLASHPTGGGITSTDAVWQRVLLPAGGSAPVRVESRHAPGDVSWQVEIRAP
jgi:hypothetical protein